MKQKTIAIIAPTGMLGSMVYRELKNQHKLLLIYRDKEKLRKLEEVYGSAQKHKKINFDINNIYQDYIKSFPTEKVGPNTIKLIEMIGQVDAVINCAGITKPHSLKNPTATLFINGLFPNILSAIYKDELIQITTDCVFDGISGSPYNETSSKFPNDLYGISKSIGEPKESLILRTSIIGPELNTSELFLDWFRKQKNKKIYGFTNYLWNGITTKQFARVCNQIIQNREKFPKNGLFHIFSTDVTKCDMLVALKNKYSILTAIEPKQTQRIDRRLRTIHDFNKLLQIPSFDIMIDEL